ncbi:MULTISPECIES: LysR family transcriptional regulator [Halomonadaceae]|uniref:LysR family transcriptional regulator n=1 Tax=Halomonadaceae TaxID=28256 RepID=UPI001597409E|nr:MULTISPECIES: LysR family transcriptional regulator [Halomonas]QJQ95673.1 LysR family transcriptional regulator [Halomonas sp. PA5]
MQPTIRQLKAFVAIIEYGSFVEASERLHLSQPALSIAIRKLEESVGGVLLNRSPRGVQLTSEGRFFLPMARRLIGDWEEALGDLGELFNKQRGKVTLAALPTLAAGFLPAVLADYRYRYPNIAISVHDVLASQVDELVSDRRADIGFSVRPSRTEATTFEPLVDDLFVAVCPHDHPLLAAETVRWEDLLTYPIIAVSRLSSTRQAIEEVLQNLNKEMNLMCEVSQIGTAGRMVAAGLGVAALPSLSFRQISSEGIDWRPLSDPHVPRTLGIITPARTPLSAAATAMLEVVREHASSMGPL